MHLDETVPVTEEQRRVNEVATAEPGDPRLFSPPELDVMQMKARSDSNIQTKKKEQLVKLT